MCKRSLWTVLGGAALAILVVLGAVGLWVGAPLTGRTAVGIPVAEVATSMMPQDPSTGPPPTPPKLPPGFVPPQYDRHLMDEAVREKPPGYPEGACQPTNPPPSPNAVASLDCVNNTLPGGPPFARYEKFADQNTLNNEFQTDVRGAALQPCPGSSDSAPGTWNATSPPPASGSVMCYISSDNMAHVDWTNTPDLIKANASGPDLASLYGWFHGLITS
jgi:hypothetical protein